MKQWNRKLGDDSHRYYDIIIAMVLLTGLTGFIVNEFLLLIPTGLLVAVAIMSKLYDRYGGTKLSLMNPKQSIRLFPGDETNLTFRMRNDSKAPILNGQLSFYSEPIVKGREAFSRQAQKGFIYQLPLSVVHKGETGVTMPITAQYRGVTRFSRLQYKFPHLIKFQPIIMDYQHKYHTEVIVYPTQKPVYGIDEVFHLSIGDQTASISPYEDLLTPIGTRDYVTSDPFHRIHWKASAKTQQLQTKVYERQVDMSWTILVNLSEHTRLGNQHISNHLEDLLSYASYLCQEATKRSFSYEMSLNMRRPHDRPYYYQPEGQGPQHLKESLELLARLNKDHLLMPMEELMYRIHQQMYKKKTILLLGEIPESCYRFIRKWQNQGVRVFVLDVQQENPVLVRIGQGGGAA
ncbi:DUF58 domain-containing protein [Halobacillus locisalis]|uniref:DUF58 domain-containing protein n=1 Tax=Halobacillus locisalis TaxID=220753 RepID=A0A838CUQ5_9BACI|nr:DUF58 domain-containing protein [Halobacillus locisalis]